MIIDFIFSFWYNFNINSNIFLFLLIISGVVYIIFIFSSEFLLKKLFSILISIFFSSKVKFNSLMPNSSKKLISFLIKLFEDFITIKILSFEIMAGIW